MGLPIKLSQAVALVIVTAIMALAFACGGEIVVELSGCKARARRFRIRYTKNGSVNTANCIRTRKSITNRSVRAAVSNSFRRKLWTLAHRTRR